MGHCVQIYSHHAFSDEPVIGTFIFVALCEMLHLI